jgi:hypothetical protein
MRRIIATPSTTIVVVPVLLGVGKRYLQGLCAPELPTDEFAT